MIESNGLVHFLTRRSKGDADRCYGHLLKVLKSRKLKPHSTWPLLTEKARQEFMEPHPARTDAQLKFVKARHEQRLEIAQRMQTIDKSSTEMSEEFNADARAWLKALRFKMLSFTDVRNKDLIDLSKTFGNFALKFSQSSRIALLCEPVQYVYGYGHALRMAYISKLLRQVLFDSIYSTPQNSTTQVLSPLVSVLDSVEVQRLALLQDSIHIHEHEWRFVPNDADQELSFEPSEIQYILVDNDERRKRLMADICLQNNGQLGSFVSTDVVTIPELSSSQH